jgi:hypothetical protein
MHNYDIDPNCFRCGRIAFATLKIEAAIGVTQLKIKADAGETPVCSTCMIELADWLNGGDEVEYIGLGNALAGLSSKKWSGR